MAKSIKEERLRWVLPIVRKETPLVAVAKICPYGKRSLERWVSLYKHGGSSALEPHSTRPKTSPRETPIRLREEVVMLRKRTGLCAKKLHWRLAKQGIHMNTRTIGKILKTEDLVRTYRVRKVVYKYVKAVLKPGELMEIDVKYVPGRIASKRYYQYTAIDCASRWRYLYVYEEQANGSSVQFLEDVMKRFPHTIKAVKTDNHSTFTNRYNGSYTREDLSPRRLHAFDHFCARRDIAHYLIDPGKPAQNGKVERSHREDQEKFYDKNIFRSFADLKRKLRRWNTEYNNLEHCGLDGKTPNEFLRDYKVMNPPNVCA